MNRRYLAPKLTNYYEAIRTAALYLEKDDKWNLSQLVNRIKHSFTVASFSYEKYIVIHLQELLDREIVQYFPPDHLSDEPRYAFGFYKKDNDEK